MAAFQQNSCMAKQRTAAPYAEAARGGHGPLLRRV